MTNKSAALEAPVGARLLDWVERHALGRKLAVALAVAALTSALLTYSALSGSDLFGIDLASVPILLNIDLVLFLALGALVGRRLVGIWIARRRGSVGARLHTRLVLWFSLIAAVPTIIVSVFSAVFFSLGVQNWFSDRVRTALDEASIVAESYLREHQQVIHGDILAMARDVNRAAPQLWTEPAKFSRLIAAQGMLRNLSEAYVFDGAGRVLARWNLSFVLDHDPIPLWALEKARKGELVVLAAGSEDRMRAIIKLDSAINAFLYIGRFVEPRVLDHIARTKTAVAQYKSLEGQRHTFEVTFTMLFVLVAVLLLLAAIWVGLAFATRLVGPISALASAAERVRGGDLSTRVEEGGDGDEIASLSKAFNRMTNQLEVQRDELLDANRQLDARRHFIETVLSGVSAGVIGLDRIGRINVANQPASELLSEDLDARIGEPFAHLVPGMDGLLSEVRGRPDQLAEMEVDLDRMGRTRTLFVRVVADVEGGEIVGFVVTFDDISELLSAQRKAAWSDVARRIAHEIKNPLTPIQLSAERLRRKYLNEIRTDRDGFDAYTDTIIRHVGDIGRMVDEFSAFAQMPSAVIEPNDLIALCKYELALYKEAHPDIVFELDLPDNEVTVKCDPGLFGRALTNLLKNAVEAIQAREGGAPPGRIVTAVREKNDVAVVSVADNGRGLPRNARERLTEPYVTTREKGTGLGLAIVKKIMEDHRGDLLLEDAPGGGTCVRLFFPKDGQAVSAPNEDGERDDRVVEVRSDAS